MSRADLVLKYFQRKHLLTSSNDIYRKQITDVFQWMGEADDIKNDATSKSLQLHANATGTIQAKQSGIVAGLEEISYLIRQENITVNLKISDGDLVHPGDIIAHIKGNAIDILGYERSILNILGRMSGIATATRQIITLMKKNELPFLAATRKTPWMFLDKKAVAVGGGLTHRLNLSDWPLIKDTYLLILKQELRAESIVDVIKEAVKRMIQSSINFFEIEVENIDQAHAALKAFEKESTKTAVMAILLDNFQTEQALQCISEIQKSPQYERILIEISGGVTEKTISSWAKIPVDVFSMGSLTHSSPAFDLSMSII